MPEPVTEAPPAMARPSSVPAAARWFPVQQEWLVCTYDAQDELHGSVQSFRAAGTPWVDYEYRHGRRHGPFKRFHPSGALAQAGRYYDDLLDGLVCFYSDGEDTYTIRECCIPEGARVMKQEHRRGQLLAESFYAVDGTQLFEPHLVPEPSASLWPEPLRERELDVRGLAWDFWPSRERLAASDPDAARVEQSLPAMRAAISRAAQRLQAYRAALLAAGEAQVPPDASPLIVTTELRSFCFASEDGAAIQVTETPALSGLGTRELAFGARIAWSALCWLCWAAGLNQIALPSELAPRPELYAALLLASERQAALTGHDLHPDAGPHFHDLNETHLPASVLAHLADHYREMRAVLLFASDPECQSPWQDDLGRVAE